MTIPVLPPMLLAEGPWTELGARLQDLGRATGQGALTLVVAIAVVLAGWGVAALLAWVLKTTLKRLRFTGDPTRVLGPRMPHLREPAGLIAWVVYWLVMSLAAMLALEVLGFRLGTLVAERLGEVIPRIVTAAVLFAVGALLAILIGAISRRFLESADVRASRLQSQVITAVLMGFSALLALEQLGFAAQFVMAVGVVAVASAGLGLALAFGMGCRELARDFLVEYLKSVDEERPKRPI